MRIHHPRGMTLIEVMVALALFALVAGGIVAASGMAHRTSVDNVADDIALHAAEGIMEQIRIMPCDPALYDLAASVAGSKPVTLYRYLPATGAAPAQLAGQEIGINTAGPVYLENVTLNASLNAKTVQTSAATLPMGVRILMKRIDGATAGVTVELIYSRYRSDVAGADAAAKSVALGTATPVAVHTLRTFIPAALQ